MTLSLRPYQRAAIDALYDYFGGNTGNPLVVMPTGTGKSVVIAGFIREAIAAYADTRVLVLTHVKELIQQNFMALLRAWPEAPAGIYSAGLSRRDIHAQILFAGIQSIHRHAYKVQRCDLVLIEGYKAAAVPKIEIHRPAYGKPPLWPENPHVVAVATDAAQDADLACPLPRLPLNAPEVVADFILDYLKIR